MPDRSLDSLSSAFQPLAFAWLARIVGRGVMVMIVQTSRTAVEHQANLANGTSGTSLSLHLPRRMRPATMVGVVDALDVDTDKADAMDLAPYEQYLARGPDRLNWQAHSREFGVIAEEAERVGLRSGARWRTPFDPGHAELVLPSKRVYLAEERTRPWPVFG